MRVEEIMCRDVVTVSPAMRLKDVARTLVEHRISGVPVVDDLGHVLGVVSEGDIVFKEQGAASEEPRRFRWLSRGAEGDARLGAVLAVEAMSQPAVTVAPERSIADAARLMVERAVNRLPVVADGKLVGIVSRADLVRAFTRSDAELEREIRNDVLLGSLWIDPAAIRITVRSGEVALTGRLDNRSQAEIVVAYVSRVPGVVSVDDSGLGWADDDLERRERVGSSWPVL